MRGKATRVTSLSSAIYSDCPSPVRLHCARTAQTDPVYATNVQIFLPEPRDVALRIRCSDLPRASGTRAGKGPFVKFSTL